MARTRKRQPSGLAGGKGDSQDLRHDRPTLNPEKPGLVAREEFKTVTYMQNSHSPPKALGSGSSHLSLVGPEPLKKHKADPNFPKDRRAGHTETQLLFSLQDHCQHFSLHGFSQWAPQKPISCCRRQTPTSLGSGQEVHILGLCKGQSMSFSVSSSSTKISCKSNS